MELQSEISEKVFNTVYSVGLLKTAIRDFRESVNSRVEYSFFS